MSKKLTIDIFKQKAIARRGQCLSDVYVNNHSHLKFRCELGHEWSAAPKTINRGSWCPICYNKTATRRRVKHNPQKIKEVKATAALRGGQCLSEKYINNVSPLKFRCKENHEWKTNWKCISKGSWCPECSNYTAGTSKLNDIRKIIAETASARGGLALSNYINGKTKILWKCSQGHTWKAHYANVVKNNSWCPKCASGLSERICRLTFETLFSKPFDKIRPTWLRKTSGRLMELDGFNQELNLAFEHHGAQHYRITHDYIKTNTQLEQRKQDDALKEQLCATNGVKLIIIPELFSQTQPNELKNLIVRKANELNITVPGAHLPIDVNYFYSKEPELQRTLKDIIEIARNQGGKCLESIYISCHTHMKFKCKKNHIWTTTSTQIKSGSWCHVCVHKTPITINDIQTLTQQKGGQCLSLKYINNSNKLTWQCGKCNNIWEASYNSIQSGTWCPPCSAKRRAKKKTLSIEDYQQAALKKGGKLLSTTYKGCYDTLTWQCRQGHVFNYRADMIKNTNRWCPICNKRKNKCELDL